MQPCYDFHCHSTASDGTLSPSQLVARAAAAGVEMLALTDHDTLAGLPEAQQAAAEAAIELITGIEISSTWSGRELHIVGLNMQADHPDLQALVAAQQQARVRRAELIGRKLDKAAGLAGSYQRAADLAGTAAPGRPWFARMLVASGRVRDEQHAFNRFLKAGQSAYVNTPWVPLDEAVQALRAAGGVAVLAHPVRYGMTRRKLRQLLADFCAAGGQGLEVAMPRLNPAQQALLIECLRDFPLYASGGSDFHTPAQYWLELGRLPALPEQARPVWELFQAA
ncbi:PHP domain-containing protein [Alcanivorax quisquiliarum]|uniref:PHP domain-containing protein n=2 Tax=Bacteria TaxID=2 RepID=A0ABT0E461_9GAMM|nr:PHP domain-containing protein [Alcanivorax quisquiliarum]MCK0536596.1 PHP domain-containing protein [Alcanivorax quisquiliarum]